MKSIKNGNFAAPQRRFSDLRLDQSRSSRDDLELVLEERRTGYVRRKSDRPMSGEKRPDFFLIGPNDIPTRRKVA